MQAIPHIETFVTAFQSSKIAYCVASLARVDKMHMTLGQAELLSNFRGVLFSATMFEDSKAFSTCSCMPPEQ